MLVWVSITAILFACFEEYKNLKAPFKYWYDFDLSFIDSLIVVWSLWVVTILLAAVPVAMGLCLIFLGRARLGWFLVGTCLALIFFWLALDGRVYRVTGVHLTSYAENLGAEDALEWVGGLKGSQALLIGPVTIGILLSVCGALGSIESLSTLQRRWSWLSSPTTSVVFALLILVGCLGLAPAQLAASKYGIVSALQVALPVNLPLLDPTRLLPSELAEFRKEFERSAVPIGLEAASQLNHPVEVEHGLASSERKPNIVVLVLESFRHDAIREMMPQLDRWADQGIQANRHYASSNRSQFGMFALLYGQSALRYQATIDANIPPQTCVSLAELGYESHYMSGGAVVWAGMDRFINDRNFDTLFIDLEDDWPQRDQRVLTKIADTLDTAERPQFVLGFLMSTHYNYRYPKQYELHLPVVEELTDNVREAEHLIENRGAILNRYRNAAGFMDDILATFLSRIDLSNTIVVITGDHGESIFDDGVLSHSSRLSEIQTRVPMLVVGPGIPKRSIDQVTSQSGPLELLLIDGKRRFRVDLARDGELTAVGFLDERAQLQNIDSQDAENWVESLGEELKLRLGNTAQESP
ncbi:unnamed protein product [Cladocopium goreaui]|uniref:Inner membrane protein YejM n=1 Tax=Cladocopium goreaui TaxID=2562237 RepID=A0A9P1BG16_9DINO|nr:unnamed protein product [Cladocopium goreaui]